jgi:methanogenic corrinoid protein MtbC1
MMIDIQPTGVRYVFGEGPLVEKPILTWPPGAGQNRPSQSGSMPWVGFPTSGGSAPINPHGRAGQGSDAGDASCAIPTAAAVELQSLLARAVEEEVVPRLLLSKRSMVGAADSDPQDTAPIAQEDVVAMVALVVTSEAEKAVAFVESLRGRGVSLERIYLDLLAPTARRLGQLWLDDLCSFAEVTVALSRLHRVVRELSPAFVTDRRPSHARRRAALLPVPGEQHTFGLLMVSEFFIRAGWEVWSEPTTTEEELTSLVGREWFAIIGLSVACEDRLEQLPALIRAVRRASRNPALGIMVGGRIFAEQPGLAAEVGADATALDGRQATLQAETLLALLTTRAER